MDLQRKPDELLADEEAGEERILDNGKIRGQ